MPVLSPALIRSRLPATAYQHEKANGTQLGISDPQFVNTFNLYQGQISASYNLDLFGKTRRRIERSGDGWWNARQSPLAGTGQPGNHKSSMQTASAK